MRRDEQLSDSLKNAAPWQDNGQYQAELVQAVGSKFKALVGMSFSGKERNRLFLSRQSKQFSDISALSGVDNVADSRVFALWDFDRDGWQDIAVVNSNAPLLSIYHNNIASSEEARRSGRFIALRFVGGNRDAQANSQFGCRDGFGTKVRLSDGDFKLLREYRCGEGMAGQNSSTMIIGIGSKDAVQSVTVEWLSGLTQTCTDVPHGTLLTVYENPEESPNGAAEVRTQYVVPVEKPWRPNESDNVPEALASNEFSFSDIQPTASTAPLHLYTTMATWCAACKRHLPQLKQLRETLSDDSLAMYGIPIDETDNPEKLVRYLDEYHPAYDLLKDLPVEKRNEVQQMVSEALRTDALPSTVMTDANGNVLLVTGGLPTISQIRKLLESHSSKQ